MQTSYSLVGCSLRHYFCPGCRSQVYKCQCVRLSAYVCSCAHQKPRDRHEYLAPDAIHVPTLTHPCFYLFLHLSTRLFQSMWKCSEYYSEGHWSRHTTLISLWIILTDSQQKEKLKTGEKKVESHCKCYPHFRSFPIFFSGMSLPSTRSLLSSTTYWHSCCPSRMMTVNTSMQSLQSGGHSESHFHVNLLVLLC